MDPNQNPITPQQPTEPVAQPLPPNPQPVGQPMEAPQTPGQVMNPYQQPQGVAPAPTQVSNPYQPQPQPQMSTPQPMQPQQPVPAYVATPIHTPADGKNKLPLIIAAIVGVVLIAGIASFFIFGGSKNFFSKVTDTITGGSSIELENYTNQNFNFSMQVPKGWAVKETDETYWKYVTFTEPTDLKDKSEASQFDGILRVEYRQGTSEFLEKTEDEYFDGVKKSIKSLLTEEVEIIPDSESTPPKYSLENEEMTTVGNFKAYKFKLKVANYGYKKDAVGYEYVMVIYVDKKTQYEISLDGHESESFHKQADSILTSFTRP